jgi:RHS repeat-associated protein
LDNETNYTYFGARYYDSDLSSWLSVDPLSDKYPSLSPYAYVANNPVILKDPNGMSIDEWDFDVETGKSTYVSNKGGDNTQHINFKYKGETIETSFETTKSEANRLRERMNKPNENWGVVGTGAYVSASFSATFGGAAGSAGNFILESEPDKSYNFTDFGANFGYDFGVAGGAIIILGPKSLKGMDIAGYSIGMDGGFWYIEGGLHTSATEKGIPTLEYVMINLGASYSVVGGGISPSRTKVTEGSKATGYWGRPNAHCFKVGTEVLMNNEYKEIQDINIGDTISCYDFVNSSIKYSVVKSKYEISSDSIFLLKADGIEIFVTDYHPFYVENKGWVKVCELEIGDWFFLSNGGSTQLFYKEKLYFNDKVYNIEVNNYHNYFVTRRNVLVHNK